MSSTPIANTLPNTPSRSSGSASNLQIKLVDGIPWVVRGSEPLAFKLQHDWYLAGTDQPLYTNTRQGSPTPQALLRLVNKVKARLREQAAHMASVTSRALDLVAQATRLSHETTRQSNTSMENVARQSHQTIQQSNASMENVALAAIASLSAQQQPMGQPILRRVLQLPRPLSPPPRPRNHFDIDIMNQCLRQTQQEWNSKLTVCALENAMSAEFDHANELIGDHYHGYSWLELFR